MEQKPVNTPASSSPSSPSPIVTATQQPAQPIKRDVLDYDDVRQLIPFFDGKPKLVKRLMHLLDIDKVNWLHQHNCDTPGVPFVQGLLRDLDITVRVDGQEVLDNLPQGAFITVSNHPFGALDGITLIKLVGEHRPDFKVMVNMVLNYITAMRPNFIAVDQSASQDPKKRAVSLHGIAHAIEHLRQGHPLGFFPAGAVAKFYFRGTDGIRIQDRPWQPSIMRIIKKARVPVIPIFFHGRNSMLSIVLGMIDWRLRTLKLPSEVFRRRGDTLHVSVGKPITADVQDHFKTPEELGIFLRETTVGMAKRR